MEFLINMISRKYEIKKQVIGRDPDLEKSGRILHRVSEWDRDGITIGMRGAWAGGLELERANPSATPCAVERRGKSGAKKDEIKGEN